MKTMTMKLMGSAAIALLFAVSVNAQTPIHTPVGVTARLADQVTVTKVTDVDFGGIFIPKNASATVTMDNTGVVSVTNGTTSLYSTNLQQLGQVRVEGNTAATFTVDYDNSVNLINGGQSLVYTPALYEVNGTAVVSGSGKKYTLPAPGNGGTLLNIAGALVIPPTSLPGTYTGSLDVVVTWE